MKYIQRVYIKGNFDRGDEVIKVLTDLGGLNSNDCDGHNSGAYYFIGPNGVITNDVPSGTIFSYVKEFYKEIKLPNWKPECEGEDYFYVSDVGIVLQETWKNNSDDGWRYTFGNCFKTYNEAAEARDKIKEILNNR